MASLRTPYRIRAATASDVPRLAGVERAAVALYEPLVEELEIGSLGRVTPPGELEAALADGHLWVVADGSDAPVGFALVREIDDVVHLEEIDVHPEHGRRGLGAAMLEAVCAWAHDAGYPAVTLSTFREVPWNGPFYARHGFRVLEAHELSPGLAAVVEDERARGLRTDLRAIMRRETGG